MNSTMSSDPGDIEAAMTTTSTSTTMTPAEPTLMGILAENRAQILGYLLTDVSRLDDVPYIIVRRMKGKWWHGFCTVCGDILSSMDEEMCCSCEEKSFCDECQQLQSACDCASEVDEDSESDGEHSDEQSEDAEKVDQPSESRTSRSSQTPREDDQPSSSDLCSDHYQPISGEIEPVKEWWDQQLDGPHPEKAKEVYHASNPTY